LAAFSFFGGALSLGFVDATTDDKVLSNRFNIRGLQQATTSVNSEVTQESTDKDLNLVKERRHDVSQSELIAT